MRPIPSVVLLSTAILIAAALLSNAGQLTPPAGPVAPTMKTLDEISTQIASLPGGGGGAAIKRVVRGVIDFPQGQFEVTASFSPNVDPSKSVVMLSNLCALDTSLSNSSWVTRSGTSLMSLTASQLTVRADASIQLAAGKVSYQIVEYN